jgi:hypothetical protein
MEKLDVVLTEFKALMDEIRNRFSLHLQVYSIYASALLLFYGIIFTQRAFDLIMAIPIFSLGLLLRVLWEQVVIRRISEYIRETIEENKIPILVGEINMEQKERNKSSDLDYRNLWMGWQHYNKAKSHPGYYKLSLFVLFIMFSVIPSLFYNAYSILAPSLGLQIFTGLSISMLVLLLIINLSIGYYMSYKIIKM